jgi:multiple antibiotic resistance protein
MDPTLLFFVAAFSSLFTIINPISAASVFISITEGDTKKKREYIAKKASITAAIVLVIFALVGNFILSFFGITIHAFMIAGGIIVASIGYKMVTAQREYFHNPKEHKEAVAKDDVSIIPLAIPMLSGPGAMTTSIVLMGETNGLFQIALLFLAIITVCLLTLVILRNAYRIDKYLGINGRKVVERIMGLIVLVVGIQFIVNGIGTLVSLWL